MFIIMYGGKCEGRFSISRMFNRTQAISLMDAYTNVNSDAVIASKFSMNSTCETITNNIMNALVANSTTVTDQ